MLVTVERRGVASERDGLVRAAVETRARELAGQVRETLSEVARRLRALRAGPGGGDGPPVPDGPMPGRANGVAAGLRVLREERARAGPDDDGPERAGKDRDGPER